MANVGPFSYQRTFADKKTEASYSMGKKLESSLTNKNLCSPAPNTYQPSFSQSKFKAPQFKIGTSLRATSNDDRRAKLVPAPGAYEIKSKAFEGLEKPKFHMGQKLVFDDTQKYINSVPGPGSHDPAYKPTKTRSPVYSMGSKFDKQKDTTVIVPGPGTYVNSAEKLKVQAPSFGFGTAKRPEVGATKFQVPGPGSYKLPAKI